MSTEANKIIVHRLWDEVWNRGGLAVADAIFDEAYAAHEKAFVPLVQAAFPDSHHAIEDLIAEGDKVVTRFIWSGTHQCEFAGIPPTGRCISVGGIWIHRLENGRIVEGRDWSWLIGYGCYANWAHSPIQRKGQLPERRGYFRAKLGWSRNP